MSFLCLIVCKVSDGKFTIICTLFHLQEHVSPVSSFHFVFCFLQFECNLSICMYIYIYIVYLSCLIFSGLPGSVHWCLSLILENSQSLLLQVFLLSYSLSSWFFNYFTIFYVYYSNFYHFFPYYISVLKLFNWFIFKSIDSLQLCPFCCWVHQTHNSLLLQY